jgi:hypothetical protein
MAIAAIGAGSSRYMHVVLIHNHWCVQWKEMLSLNAVGSKVELLLVPRVNVLVMPWALNAFS